MRAGAERLYAGLLRVYPQAYRRERGAEMLATLVEAGRPVGREAAALIVGGLRARAGLTGFTTPGRLWLSALRLAALVLVAQATAQAAVHSAVLLGRLLGGGGGLSRANGPGDLVTVGLGLLALLALAAGRYAAGGALIAGAFVFHFWALGGFTVPGLPWNTLDRHFGYILALGEFWQLPLALLLSLALVRRRPAASPRPWTWLLAVPAAVLLQWQPRSLLILGVAALLWALVDARIAVAASALPLVQVLTLLGFYAPGWIDGRAENLPSLITYGVFTVALVAAGTGLTRRQARL